MAAAEDNKYLAFLLGEETYGMPLLKIKEIIGKVDVTHIPKSPSFMRGVANLRGKIIPIIDLKLKFGIGETEFLPRTCIIVVELMTEEGVQTSGLMVDEVSGVLDISEGYIEPVPNYSNSPAAEYLAGIGKVKDEIVTLLDVDKILASNNVAASVGVEKDAK